jgi:hypothetical protein
MYIQKMLAELRQAREQVEEAIVAMERLALGHGKRVAGPLRGQPKTEQSGAGARLAVKINRSLKQRRKFPRCDD